MEEITKSLILWLIVFASFSWGSSSSEIFPLSIEELFTSRVPPQEFQKFNPHPELLLESPKESSEKFRLLASAMWWIQNKE